MNPTFQVILLSQQKTADENFPTNKSTLKKLPNLLPLEYSHLRSKYSHDDRDNISPMFFSSLSSRNYSIYKEGSELEPNSFGPKEIVRIHRQALKLILKREGAVRIKKHFQNFRRHRRDHRKTRQLVCFNSLKTGGRVSRFTLAKSHEHVRRNVVA